MLYYFVRFVENAYLHHCCCLNIFVDNLTVGFSCCCFAWCLLYLYHLESCPCQTEETEMHLQVSQPRENFFQKEERSEKKTEISMCLQRSNFSLNLKNAAVLKIQLD